MKIDIKNILDNTVIYSHEQEDNSIGITLEKGVKEGVAFHYADLRLIDLVNLNLAGADFMGANFTGADLSNVNLAGSCLAGTNFTGTYLTDVNLSKTNLAWSKLIDVYLENSDFTGANLSGARFARTCLAGTKLTGAKYREATLEKGLLQIGGKKWPILIFDQHIKIGCEMHKTSEWEKFTDDEITDMDDDALVFWKENKEIILMLAKHHQGAENVQETNQNREQREAKKSGGSAPKYMET